MNHAAKRKSEMLLLASAVALTGGLASVPSGRATLLAYEGFNYTAGATVDSLGGGTGWSDNWSSANPNPPSVTAGGLTFGSLVTVGDKLTVPFVSGENGRGAQRNLSSSAAGYFDSGDNLTNSTAWMSILVQPGSDTTDNLNVQLGNTANSQPSFTIASAVVGSGTYYGFDGPSSFDSTGVSVKNGTTVFLVAEITFVNPGAFSEGTNVTLYVDPTPGLTAPAAGTASVSGSIKTLAASGGVSVIGNGWSFDELRFGTTYADVAPAVPEPAPLALAAAAGAGLLLLGRQRRSI